MQVVNRLATQLGVQWRKDMKKCGCFVAVCDLCDEQKVIFLKPKVAMNVNGRRVHKTGTVYYVPGS
jgi:peptidyl-tRNA hydrolase